MSMLLRCAFLLYSISNLYHAELTIDTEILQTVQNFTGAIDSDFLYPFREADILVIKNSNITDWKPGSFSVLPKLKTLIVKDNHVKFSFFGPTEEFLGATDGLKKLQYSQNIHDDPRPEVTRTLKLEVYIFKDMNYPVFENNVYNESTLRELVMSGLHGEIIKDNVFNGLNELRSLDIHKNKFGSIPNTALYPLKSLKYLNIKENLIEKFRAADLPFLPKLEVIDISCNPLKDLDLIDIEKVAPSLKEIDVTGTKLTESYIEELRKTTTIYLKSEN